MSQLIPSTAPLRVFKDNIDVVRDVAVLPDRRHMITGSWDKTLRLWDLKKGVVLKKMEGHCRAIKLKAHSTCTYTLDFSPDGTTLATGSSDRTTKLWTTKTWQLQGNPIDCSATVHCVRYSPSGELLAVATDINIEIYNSATRARIVNFKGHERWNLSLAWTPDGTRLLSAGDEKDPSIREWDVSTWKQVGDPWTGHTNAIYEIAIHPAGILVASASYDRHVHLWRLSDRRAISIFRHSAPMTGVTFSANGKYILSGGYDNMISEWELPKVEVSDSKILTINTTARNAYIAEDLSTAEELFTQEIVASGNNYISYANRSFVMARKHDWDHALDDAIQSITIQPTLTGYILKGIIQCRKGQVRDARTTFDIAFMFTNEDSKMIHFLLLVKAIALFGDDRHEETMQLVQQLTAACPNNDTLACCVVEAYLHMQLGIKASNGSHHDEAVEHFTAAVNSSALSSKLNIHLIYEDLVMLFGWDLKSLWQNAHQNRCDALRQACRLKEALESYQQMMDTSDEHTKAACLDWSNAFKHACSALYISNGDDALDEGNYDRAIDSYTVAIKLNSTNETIFANRSKAMSKKMLWEDALLDAQKLIELNPSSHVGYELKHAALHGAKRYGEAIEAFQMMLSKLDNAPNMQTQKLRQKYVSPSKAAGIIQKVVDIQLNTAPPRLLNATTGLLCDREAQKSAFKKSTEYNDLLLSTMKHPDLRGCIAEKVATYFSYVMLSHRWDDTEPLLHDIKDKVVYELKADGRFVKLRSFCGIVHSETEYHWAWVDSCCIDQTNNVELQTSLDSMFAWYHHSALTAVYLSDIPPSSKSGALAKSAWNTRGWTVPEFLAPKVIRFYQQDWTPYLEDHSLNHKESVEIMHELEGATGIDARTLVAFQPGMRDAREKLQWASARVTTRPEDIAYSLFGIFDVRLPIHYGENAQNALGRLLQKIVAQSGDITALDWVGQPSMFNSCLPANISSYAAPPCALPSLSEDEIHTAVSSLQNDVAVTKLALKIYDQLDNTGAPRFANCRLHLPCIAFRVTEVRRKNGTTQDARFTYGMKAVGLKNLLITTKEALVQFSREKPTRQKFLLVRPWDRRPLELPGFPEPPAFADDAQSLGDWSELESSSEHSPGSSPVEPELDDPGSQSRALQLMVRLGQLFGAFLLARQPGGEYKRIASDHNIIAKVRDVTAVTDVRTLEIL